MAIMTTNFYSYCLNRTVAVEVVLPTDKVSFPDGRPMAKGPFKTMYLLHGLHGNYTDWITQTRVIRWATQHDLALVMPSGDNRFYVDSALSGERYGTFITRELVDFTRATFDLSHRREDTYLAGLSMGGFGAIVNGLAHPETFGAVAAMSSALERDAIASATDEPSPLGFTRESWRCVLGMDPADYPGSPIDYERIARELAAADGPKPRIWMGCGCDDHLFGCNVAYRDLLRDLGLDVTWFEAEGHAHHWEFWNLAIRKVIDWLDLGQATQGVDSGAITGSSEGVL